jgi:ribosomal protein S18 acetylase RimI-like enzyme
MMLVVRQFRSSDYESVWALHRLAVDGTGVSAPDWYFSGLKKIESAFLNNRGEFVVAEYEGKIVAMGALRHTSDDRAEITRMRVQPHFQGRGFGSEVLRYLEGRAVCLGYTVLHLDTAVEQQRAQSFYLQNGYQRIGVGTKAGFDVVCFEKKLF